MNTFLLKLVSPTLFVFLIGAQFLQAQPNILLIIADDLGTDATNGYIQSPEMPTTPNLDALMANGIKFTNTWAAPVCTPTRAAIMSGKYGVKTGVLGVPGTLDTSHVSLFKRMNALACDNYAKAVIGKWHLSSPTDPNHPANHGVDHFEGILPGAVMDYSSWTKVTNGATSQQSDYVTTNFTDGAINWISNQTQPWFLWLAHVAPHSPYHVPPAHMYTRTNTTSNTDKFLAMIESLDYEIGRLLSNIPADELENTIIIYIGDNGTPNNVLQSFPAGRGKGSLYQGGVGVPMIISGYGVGRKGETEDALTHVVDLHSTILNMTGGNLINGIDNSLPMDSLFVPNEATTRLYNYSEATNNMNPARSGWTIRNQRFKLIDFDNGTQAFYNLMNDPFENNNLIGNLNTNQTNAKNRMEAEAAAIQNGWSCQDYIQNGDEVNKDCGGTYCTACVTTCPNINLTSTSNIGCCVTPTVASFYFESIVNGKREILTNNFPNHDYCHTAQNVPAPKYYTFEVPQNPVLNDYKTSVLAADNRPDWFFGVALNSVLIAPAPATPFIFENTNTGQYNWDWVFEPTNTQGSNTGNPPGSPWVQLDCSSAHTGPQGYHYHGNMFEYVETIQAGISTTMTPPTTPIQVGWAADGYPILYRFGPDGIGGLALLQPGYSLKPGDRPGNGISAPCGPFNGRYTNDYQFSCDVGDLDECNGIERSVTLTTPQGPQTFDYFYVITESFPQIPRCHSGERDVTFNNSNNGSTTPHQLPPGDLAPTLKVLPSTLQGISAMNIVVKVTEIALRDTDGSTITVRVPKDPRLTFTWDPTLTNIGFDQVQNNQWTYSSNALFHTFETANVITAGDNLSFGFISSYDPQNTSGQSTITMTIVPASGGETQYNNNADAELLTYFN